MKIDEIRIKLEKLIEAKGTMDLEVLRVSEELDLCIANYYESYSSIKIGQAF